MMPHPYSATHYSTSCGTIGFYRLGSLKEHILYGGKSPTGEPRKWYSFDTRLGWIEETGVRSCNFKLVN